MAISGSGGWIPSKGVRLERGHLVWSGIPQNKPKDLVEQDMSVAARRIVENPGEIIQVHFFGANALTLARNVREMIDGQ